MVTVQLEYIACVKVSPKYVHKESTASYLVLFKLYIP